MGGAEAVPGEERQGVQTMANPIQRLGGMTSVRDEHADEELQDRGDVTGAGPSG